MAGINGWLASLPTGVRRVVAGFLFLLLYGGLYVLAVLLLAWLQGGPPNWAGPLGGFLGSGLGVGLGLWIRRRRMGSSERVRAFDRALRTRRLPDDADPADWVPLLAGERRALRRSQVITIPVVALMFAAAAVSAVVLGLGVNGAVSVVVAGMVLICVMWMVARRNAARIDALTAQLSRN